MEEITTELDRVKLPYDIAEVEELVANAQRRAGAQEESGPVYTFNTKVGD